MRVFVLEKCFCIKFVTLAFLVLFLLLPAFPTAAQELKSDIAEALNTGDTAKAIELLNHSIDIDKGYYYNYAVLGQIYYKQMKCQLAKENFELALDKKSKHYESLYYLGLCLLKMDSLDQAKEMMEKGRKKARKEKHMFENGYGLVMMAEKDYQEADRAFRAALVDDPKNPEYHINLGDANFYQGIPSLAISEYKKALEVDTASLEVYYHWAEAALEMKDYTSAIEKLRIVLSKDSTHADAWMRAGGIYFKAALSSRQRQERKDRFIDAIGSYKRYVELSGAKPDTANVRVFFGLAMSYANIYGFEDAARYFDDVLSIPYEARDIYFYYGKSLWGIKRYADGAEAFQKHIDWVSRQENGNFSHVDDVELYRMWGDCYYYEKDNKNYSSAIKYYKKSLEADSSQGRVLYNVAVGYHQMKSYVQAIEYYDKRIALGIDSANSSIYRNAGYCALNVANNAAAGEDELALDEEEEDMGSTDAVMNGVDPNLNYYEVAVDYMKSYLEHNPNDAKVINLVADAYLRYLSDCANGVDYFQKLLVLEPDNCDAKKMIGYAYFGGICTKNYVKALRHLTDAYRCRSAVSGACGDVDLLLWIGQCYHLIAADKASAKQDTNEDFKNAFIWYGKVLKCDPSNKVAKKGQDDTRFEFYDENEK
jgi:tetratricopeptide (TPR) repeat protein